jgi:hypothetical protein
MLNQRAGGVAGGAFKQSQGRIIMPRSYKTRSGAKHARTGLKRSANRLDPDFDEIGSAGRTGRSGRNESTRSTVLRGGRKADEHGTVLDILDSRSAGNVRQPSGTRGMNDSLPLAGTRKQRATSSRRKASTRGGIDESPSSRTSRQGTSRPRAAKSRGTSRSTEPAATTSAASDRRSRAAAGPTSKTRRGTARNRAGSRTATARRTKGKRSTPRR